MVTMKIQGYHVHVYCQPEQHTLCEDIRTKMMADLGGILGGAGPVRNRPVGPHPLPMFEAWFQPNGLNSVLEWILANRSGLPVLIHPLSGNDYEDHAKHGIWIGEKLQLDLSVL